MRIHETTIVGIAELIAAKKETIEKMRADQEFVRITNINEVFINVDSELDVSHLFDNSQDIDGPINAALVDKLPWIIDHVYDHAIQKLESKIESNIQQLKLDLLNEYK